MTTLNIPADIAALFESDSRIARVVAYLDGWVPNSYRWRAPGRRVTYQRLEDGSLEVTEGEYDRKRSYGRGPSLVAFSARGGRLASAR